MVEFTDKQFAICKDCVDEALKDITCLEAWVDSLEYDVKNYIGEKPFTAFRGYCDALKGEILYLQDFAKSKTLL